MSSVHDIQLYTVPYTAIHTNLYTVYSAIYSNTRIYILYTVPYTAIHESIYCIVPYTAIHKSIYCIQCHIQQYTNLYTVYSAIYSNTRIYILYTVPYTAIHDLYTRYYPRSFYSLFHVVMGGGVSFIEYNIAQYTITH